MQKETRSPGLFRANMAVAMSEAGKVGVKEILKSWSKKITNFLPLERLEKTLTECRELLRKLGAELAKERRRREMILHAELETLSACWRLCCCVCRTVQKQKTKS